MVYKWTGYKDYYNINRIKNINYYLLSSFCPCIILFKLRNKKTLFNYQLTAGVKGFKEGLYRGWTMSLYSDWHGYLLKSSTLHRSWLSGRNTGLAAFRTRGERVENGRPSEVMTFVYPTFFLYLSPHGFYIKARVGCRINRSIIAPLYLWKQQLTHSTW